MKFLLDTNFLILPAQFHVDVFRELEAFGLPRLYTLSLVVKELEKLAASRGKKASFARLALLQVKKEGVTILPATGATDKALVEVGRKGFVVCTQDAALIKRLQRKRVKVVTLRQKKTLIMH